MIPNIFHFVFGLKEQTEPFHLMYYLCLASCIEVNKPDKVCFHYHHEPYGEWWEQIKPKLHLRRIQPERFVADYQYGDAFIGQYRYAHLSDFSRLQILYDEGGFYADIDTLFLRPFPVSCLSGKFVLGKEKALLETKDGGSLCNAWIASAKNDEFCRLWLEQMPSSFDGTWSNHSTLLPYRLSCQFPHLIDVEPESSFYALDYTRQGINALFLHDTPLPENAYSLHLWNHLWFNPKRLDFSHFHCNLLTVDYVVFANTTYARHARRFLHKDVVGSLLRYGSQTAISVLRHPWHNLLSWQDAR